MLVYGAGRMTCRVPQCHGLTLGDAEARLRAAGLTWRREAIGEAPSADRAHRVWRQDPAPGAEVARGSRVRLFVYGAARRVEPVPVVPRPAPARRGPFYVALQVTMPMLPWAPETRRKKSSCPGPPPVTGMRPRFQSSSLSPRSVPLPV